ncbi:MAG: lipopolysaccharide biosynthesis glycosyltransferase, partial [Vicingaceae bacterium]
MLAIVTVTDENFYLGTQVMFYSFLKHNSNFEGDLVVIHHQLPQSIQDK